MRVTLCNVAKSRRRVYFPSNLQRNFSLRDRLCNFDPNLSPDGGALQVAEKLPHVTAPAFSFGRSREVNAQPFHHLTLKKGHFKYIRYRVFLGLFRSVLVYQLTWLLSSFVSFIASSKHSETCLFSSAFDMSSFCK